MALRWPISLFKFASEISFGTWEKMFNSFTLKTYTEDHTQKHKREGRAQ